METPEQGSSEASNVAVTCLKILLSDEAWRDIGFTRRPRVGALFQRFRPAWKVNLENRVAQTMLAALTAAHATAGKISYDSVPEVIAAYTGRPDMAAQFGYASPDEGIRHLSQLVAEYLETPVGDWHILIATQIGSNMIPDKKQSARILFGCIKFSEVVKMMVVHLRSPPPKQRTDDE
jgi:hypothetical protein